MLKKVLCQEGAVKIGLDEDGCLTKVFYGPGNRTESTRIKDTRCMTCPYCGQGWETTVKSLTNQTYMMELRGYAHESCHVGHLAVGQRLLFQDAMADAKLGFKVEDVEILESRYGGAWNTPWYSIRPNNFPQALITFGRRKRVYVCELELPDHGVFRCRKCSSLTLSWDGRAGSYICLTHGCGHSENFKPIPEWVFRGEDCTKEISTRKVMIHAWTDQKVREYIKEFARILGEPSPMRVG